MTTASTPRIQVEEVVLPERTIAGLRERVATGDMPAFFARAVPAAAAELGRAGIAPAGPPVAAYRQEIGDTFEVTVGFPVAAAPRTDALVRMTLPAGRVVQAVHAGPYETLTETYGRLADWFAARHLTPPPLMWEDYLVGPEGGADACRTRVVFPLP
jgi:effector-binding domain-containing protein